MHNVSPLRVALQSAEWSQYDFYWHQAQPQNSGVSELWSEDWWGPNKEKIKNIKSKFI